MQQTRTGLRFAGRRRRPLLETISRLSLIFAVAGVALAGGGQLAGLGAGRAPPWAMAAWIFGCPLLLAAVFLSLVPRWLGWTARRFPGLAPPLALAPLCVAGVAGVVGLGKLMVRLMP